MAKILAGTPVREQIALDLRNKIKKLGRSPVLVIVQVGDRADSNVYIKNKIKFGEEIGVTVLYQKYGENIKEIELIKEINKFNEETLVDGIIVQLPLPQSLDREKVVESIDLKKDVDGLRSSSVEETTLVTPATARGVMALLDFYNIEVKDKKVAVIGRSRLAGAPIAQLLEQRGAKVAVCHRGTENIAEVCRGADILISAAGQVGLVTKEFVTEGQVVVDVGINRPHPALRVGPPLDQGRENRDQLEKPKIVGDVAFEEVEPIVSAITPVPGGIGPLTVACLFGNLLDLVDSKGL